MCLKDVADKLKKFYKEDRQTFIGLAVITFIGIALRLFFINSTDISGDEVFFVTYAYKIAYLLWSAPLVAVVLAVIAIASAYLIIIKRSFKATIAIAAVLLIAKFGLGIPYLMQAPPPLFVLTTAATIFVTGLAPNIAGELVSSLAMVGLAFVGLFIGRKWNKNAGFLAFALILFSPYNVFMSATSFLGPLGWFLAFASLAVFFEAQKKPNLLPLAGALAGLAFATRFPTLIIIPFFAGIAWINKEKLLKKENKKNVAIFATLIITVVLFYTPLILNQFESARGWEERGGGERWDLTEAHMSAPIAEAVETEGLPSEDFLFLFKVMNFFYSPFFMLLLAFALPFAAYHAFKSKNYELASILLIGIGAFVFFFSVLTMKRTNRALGYELPAIMLVSFMLASIKKFPRTRQMIAGLLVAVFLVGSINVVMVHDFKGISEFVTSIPEDSIVYTKEAYFTANYYKEIYKYDLSIRKPLFDKIFTPDASVEALFQEKRKLVIAEPSDFEKADYALVVPELLEEPENELNQALQKFKRCRTIENGKYDMLVVFARETCP